MGFSLELYASLIPNINLFFPFYLLLMAPEYEMGYQISPHKMGTLLPFA
jgi:hypothetical protein